MAFVHLTLAKSSGLHRNLVEITCLLCDWAQELNGKLYIQGAGWNRAGANQPLNVALAILIAVPWDQTNRTHSLRGFLMTEDEEPFLAPNEQPVEIQLQFEVGRPPGVRPGTAINAPFTMSFAGLSLPPGTYSFRVQLNGDEKCRASFVTVEGGV